MGNTQYDVRRNDDLARLKFLLKSLTKGFPDYGDPLVRVPQPLVRLHPDRPRKPTKRADKNYEKYDSVYAHGRFDVGDVVSAKGIAEGVSNSNWLVETTGRDGAGARFILTMYEFRIELDDLPYFLSLLDHLAARGCPVQRSGQGI